MTRCPCKHLQKIEYMPRSCVMSQDLAGVFHMPKGIALCHFSQVVQDAVFG